MDHNHTIRQIRFNKPAGLKITYEEQNEKGFLVEKMHKCTASPVDDVNELRERLAAHIALAWGLVQKASVTKDPGEMNATELKKHRRIMETVDCVSVTIKHIGETKAVLLGGKRIFNDARATGCNTSWILEDTEHYPCVRELFTDVENLCEYAFDYIDNQNYAPTLFDNPEDVEPKAAA